MTEALTIKGLQGGAITKDFEIDKIIDTNIITGVYRAELYDKDDIIQLLFAADHSLYEVYTDPTGQGYPTDVEYIAVSHYWEYDNLDDIYREYLTE